MTKEQRQLITLRAPTLEKAAIIEALYLILGPDYKAGGWNHNRNKRFQRWSNSSRAYAAQDDWWEDDDYGWDDETGYYEDDEQVADYDLEEEEFDADAAYYGDEPWPDEATEAHSPGHMAEEYNTAFASYTDARRRFNELKMARGFLPWPTTNSLSWPVHLHPHRALRPGREKERGKVASPRASLRRPCAILHRAPERVIPRAVQRPT